MRANKTWTVLYSERKQPVTAHFQMYKQVDCGYHITLRITELHHRLSDRKRKNADDRLRQMQLDCTLSEALALRASLDRAIREVAVLKESVFQQNSPKGD